ncbi:MAG: IS110 family transposase [Methanothrix sp.]|nr:IS110 family transposase [Methanothrix sp.]
MRKQQDKACGADIHKRFLMACILSRDGSKVLNQFEMTVEGILSFSSWLKENNCKKVAVESTGNYWHLVYQVLDNEFEFILGNAFKTRRHYGAKTDKRDAEWLAELCLNNQIEPSRILPKEDRELRALTRARKGYVDFRSKLKTRTIQELEACTIKLASELSDVFGKSGRHILQGLIDCRRDDDIIQTIPSKRVRKNKDRIKQAIQVGLSPISIFLIASHLQMIDEVDKKLVQLDAQISRLLKTRKKDVKIAMSMPGISFVSAAAILSEIGDYRKFASGKKLAAFCGIDPSVYESAGKRYTGKITKSGSKYLRRMMIECAHAFSKTKARTHLKRFYLRIMARRGKNIATVALARKMLVVLHHLLINQEIYEDDGLAKPRNVKVSFSEGPNFPSLDEMIKVLVDAGYFVKKESLGG